MKGDAWNAIGAALCASGVFVIAMALMGQVGVAWFALCIQFQYFNTHTASTGQGVATSTVPS